MEQEIKQLVKNISYSSLTDWNLCPHYYKLSHIDKLRPYTSTPATAYGHVLHQFIQDVLQDKITPADGVKKFERLWKKFCSLYKLPQYVDYIKNGSIIIAGIKDEMQNTVGAYKKVHAEVRLEIDASENFSQNFKGFVDLIFELENGNVAIVDLKTADSAFMFNKFKDKIKDYQLTLYKRYYCKIFDIDPLKVKTYFTVLEKNLNSKKPLSSMEISSGERKVKNALEWVESSLYGINAQKFIKNRSSCHKFGQKYPCFFYGSAHCPKGSFF